jgi:ankyrin repeat protein
VKQMIHIIDVDGFYMGSDGSETCALHTAAFHGAAQVLDFLCQGIDDCDPQGDGGLCDVNGRDNNGWTALHFAAGANSVTAARVLARHGAKLAVEANNGYTPLQWALRLSNGAVAEELKNLTKNRTDQAGWMPSRPLATIANRFFSLIPSH